MKLPVGDDVSMSSLKVERQAIGTDASIALIAALNAELMETYPEDGANFFGLDASEVSPGNGAFLVASLDGQAVGCGAVRRLDAEVAEIKRMYVAPSFRGRGIARAVLRQLEEEARSLGVVRLVLETGGRQPEALALYRGAGFTEIPCSGEYADAPLSVCMGKDLR